MWQQLLMSLIFVVPGLAIPITERPSDWDPEEVYIWNGVWVPDYVWEAALDTPGYEYPREPNGYWEGMPKDNRAPGVTPVTAEESVGSAELQDTATSSRKPRRIQPEVLSAVSISQGQQAASSGQGQQAASINPSQPAVQTSPRCRFCNFSVAEVGGHPSEHCPFKQSEGQFSEWFKFWYKNFDHTAETVYQPPKRQKTG